MNPDQEFLQKIGSKVSFMAKDGTQVNYPQDPFPLVKPFKQRSLPALAKRYLPKEKKEKQSTRKPGPRYVTLVKNALQTHFANAVEQAIVQEKMEERQEKQEVPKLVEPIVIQKPKTPPVLQIKQVPDERPLTRKPSKESISVSSASSQKEYSSPLKNLIKRIVISSKYLDFSLLDEISKIVAPVYFQDRENDIHLRKIKPHTRQQLDFSMYDIPFQMDQSQKNKQPYRLWEPNEEAVEETKQIEDDDPHLNNHDDLQSWDYTPQWDAQRTRYVSVTESARSQRPLDKIDKKLEHLGGLGPDKDSLEYKDKLKKMNKKKEYAEKIRAMSFESLKSTAPKTDKKLRLPVIKQESASKRERMKNYSKTVKKPESSKSTSSELPRLETPRNTMSQTIRDLEQKHLDDIKTVQSIRKEMGL